MLSEIFSARVVFFSWPECQSDLGRELAKIDRAVGWVGRSPHFQGVGQMLNLDLSSGAHYYNKV